MNKKENKLYLGDRVMYVEVATMKHLILKMVHGCLGVPQIVIRDHHEASVLALGIHTPDRKSNGANSLKKSKEGRHKEEKGGESIVTPNN